MTSDRVQSALREVTRSRLARRGASFAAFLLSISPDVNQTLGGQPSVARGVHVLTRPEVRTLLPGSVPQPVYDLADPTNRNLFGRDETGIPNRRRVAITTDSVWSALWREANGPNVPTDLPPAPTVDFARDAAVVASLGERPNAGWRIVVRGAAIRHDTLFVVVRTDRGVPGCGRHDDLVSPIAVGRVRRHGWTTVQFLEISRDLKQCG